MTSKPSSALLLVENQEYDYPETIYIRDIDNRVFQGIVIQSLASIEGISLLEGGFIDHLFSRSHSENVKGISVEQDGKSQSVSIHIEVNVAYGVAIPPKAEEIQRRVSAQVTALTGLHVNTVHVVFKGLSPMRKEAKTVTAPMELVADDTTGVAREIDPPRVSCDS